MIEQKNNVLYLGLDLQTEKMRKSIDEIIKRQNRKCIPTIICGVHIIPEILYDTISGENIKYINLYFDCEKDLYSHLKIRDNNKYGEKNIPFLFKMSFRMGGEMKLNEAIVVIL